MPKEFPCTLSLLASCYDIGFLEQTVRHVVRTCRYPFVERLLNIDLDSGSDDVLAELRKICQRLIADAVIDRVVEFDRTIGQDLVFPVNILVAPEFDGRVTTAISRCLDG